MPDGERLRRRIWELTNPSLTVTVEVVRVAVGELLVIIVSEGLEVHAVAGRATHRVGKSCEPMSSSEQARLVEDRRGSDWSAEPSGQGVSEASPLALAAARQLLRGS